MSPNRKRSKYPQSRDDKCIFVYHVVKYYMAMRMSKTQQHVMGSATLQLTNSAEREEKNIWFGSIFTKFKK